MIKSSKHSDLDYFELIQWTLLKTKNYPQDSEIDFWRNSYRAYSHFRVESFDNVIKMFRSPLF